MRTPTRIFGQRKGTPPPLETDGGLTSISPDVRSISSGEFTGFTNDSEALEEVRSLNLKEIRVGNPRDRQETRWRGHSSWKLVAMIRTVVGFEPAGTVVSSLAGRDGSSHTIKIEIPLEVILILFESLDYSPIFDFFRTSNKIRGIPTEARLSSPLKATWLPNNPA